MKARGDRFNAAMGRQIRAEIAASGRSISSVSRDLGLARSALDNYVTGKRAIPVPVVYQLGEILSIDPQLIVQRANERFLADDEAERSNVITGSFGVRGVPQDERAVAKKKGRDRGEDADA